MDFAERIRQVLPGVAASLVEGWHFSGGGDPDDGRRLGGQKAVQQVLQELISVLFPGCHGEDALEGRDCQATVATLLQGTLTRLSTQVEQSLLYSQRVGGADGTLTPEALAAQAEALVCEFATELPAIQRLLQSDIQAAYEGDPAAKSTMEVVLSYPGLYAIAVHRVAHFLFARQVPLIPRIMAESAHSQTGIDIHPGAAIGPAFFIDHGTGVVIGETCSIGSHVKIYQGVTLGALSFQKDGQGHLVKGIKRHPNVEDHVIIYAGATILGGETTIGAHSIIGGNVWLTHSVPPHSKVYNQQPEPLIRGPASP